MVGGGWVVLGSLRQLGTSRPLAARLSSPPFFGDKRNPLLPVFPAAAAAFAAAPAFLLRRNGGSLGVTTTAGSESSVLSTSSSSSSSILPPVQTELAFTSLAFERVSTFRLLRAISIFGVCRVKSVVTHSLSLVQLAYRLLGRQPTHFLLRLTFFGHFCGGEQIHDLYQSILALQSQGVGSILDYAAEKDVLQSSLERTTPDCLDTNLSNFQDAIRHASTQPRGFVAIKLSSLACPHLLKKSSVLLKASRQLFCDLYFEGKNLPISSCQVQDLEMDQKVFVQGSIKVLGICHDESTKMFHTLTMKNTTSTSSFDNKTVQWHQWYHYFSPLMIGRHNSYVKKGINVLSEQEAEEWEALERRIHALGKTATDTQNTSVLIDAEQTYLQLAIDYVTMKHMQIFNKQRAVVFNTYQAYLRSTLPNLRGDVKWAAAGGFRLGVKLVRGAYMVQERAIAKREGIASPINQDMAATHVSFDTCVTLMLDNLGTVEVVLGTHNENSVLKAVSHLQRLRPPSSFLPTSNESLIHFAQLFGMCDHVTLTLGRQGFSAFKYVPYGPIQEVLPYLVRRAQENSDLLGGSVRESSLIGEELKRRAKQIWGWYKSAGIPKSEGKKENEKLVTNQNERYMQG